MIKINYTSEIKETSLYLENRYKELTHAKLKERCEILIWLKTGKVKTMKKAMDLKGKSGNHGSNLWRQYKLEGIEKFLELKYVGQPSPLSDKKELFERLETTGFSTIKEAQVWILETYGLEYTENGLGNYFRKHKIKLKTGRPEHPKQDATKRALYKKSINKN